MKVSTENDNTFGYEKIMIVVDNIPLKIEDFWNLSKSENIFDLASMYNFQKENHK